MRRGEIWLVDLGTVRGSEASHRRPAVIVSNEGANKAAARLGRGVVTVAPITSNVARVYPFQIVLPPEASGLDFNSKVQAEQIRSIDVRRLERVIAHVPPELMPALDDALRLHLQL